MITNIKLDGFKTFKDFDLELGPFQIIVGPNGAGKSNLFDALRLLSELANTDLRSAFQELRGDAGELFTTLPDGQSVDRMRMTIDMMVERMVQDSWGVRAELKYTRLRYELEISRGVDEQGLQRLYVTYEALNPILRSKDNWFQKYIGKAKDEWRQPLKAGRGVPFISTETKGETVTINLHQDGHGGHKAAVAQKAERTVLSGVINTESPHAFAAREEMRNWRFLRLNPEVISHPSSMLMKNDFLLPDGSNLPTVLARMEAEEPYLLSDVSRDLANLVPGILNIKVEKDQARERYIIQATTQDGRTFSSRVLSEGTLRMLALVTLKNDPQHRGVLCFEEPENGLHPFRLKNMVHLLCELATDFSNAQGEEPLRQLLVNTHSPLLVSQPEVIKNLLLAYTATSIEPKENKIPIRITRIAAVRADSQLQMNLEEKEASYILAQVVEYLNSAEFGEFRSSSEILSAS